MKNLAILFLGLLIFGLAQAAPGVGGIMLAIVSGVLISRAFEA